MTLSKLLRRTTAAALCAIAALTVPGVATAQTVTLSTGQSCVYSAMTVNPSGNVTVQCGASTAPGTFSLVAPGSLSTSSSSTASQVYVTRTSGSAGAVDIDFSISTPTVCSSATTSPIAFAAGDTTAKPIIVDTSAAGGTCSIQISTATTGATIGTGIRNVSVVDPAADVTFAFAAASTSTSVTGGQTVITVNRGGGTGGAWTVPITISGGLTLNGSMIAGAGSLSTLVLTFPANSSSASVTYTAPSVTPTIPGGLPSSVTLLLGTPVATAPVLSGQNGTVVLSANTHTVNLGPPPVAGCGTPSATDPTLNIGDTGTLQLANGTVFAYVLPLPVNVLNGRTRVNSGYYVASETTNSADHDFSVEVQISKCKGVITVPTGGNTCYKIGTLKAQPIQSFYWITTLTAAVPSPAAVVAKGACYTPPSEGPWYLNVRYNYAPGLCTGSCGWKQTYQLWQY
jgi:hypothetical protein